MSALPLLMLQYEFQTFFITAQKPRLGLAVTVVSAIANMILDYLFMAMFWWGLPGAAMFGAAEFLGRPLAQLFVGYDAGLMELTVRGFLIYSFSFLFSGIAIFGSAFFTALNDGLTSAAIAFLRSLVFEIAAVLVFPLIWGVDGIWGSIVGAELRAAAVTLVFLAAKRKRYQY